MKLSKNLKTHEEQKNLILKEQIIIYCSKELSLFLKKMTP